jgi:hypothetical protein
MLPKTIKEEIKDLHGLLNRDSEFDVSKINYYIESLNDIKKELDLQGYSFVKKMEHLHEIGDEGITAVEISEIVKKVQQQLNWIITNMSPSSHNLADQLVMDFEKELNKPMPNKQKIKSICTQAIKENKSAVILKVFIENLDKISFGKYI